MARAKSGANRRVSDEFKGEMGSVDVRPRGLSTAKAAYRCDRGVRNVQPRRREDHIIDNPFDFLFALVTPRDGDVMTDVIARGRRFRLAREAVQAYFLTQRSRMIDAEEAAAKAAEECCRLQSREQDLIVGLNAFKSRAEAAEASLVRLKEVCDESNQVCACGCSADAHENYGEDGESCQDETHSTARAGLEKGRENLLKQQLEITDKLARIDHALRALEQK